MPAPVFIRSFPLLRRPPPLRPQNRPLASLATPESLDTLLKTTPPPLILDVRGRVIKPVRVDAGRQPFVYAADRASFAEAHVPTAAFLDWRTISLIHPPAVPRSATVVAYDWGDMLFATRAWLALRAAGVDAAVLDGGWAAWLRAGKPTAGLLRAEAGGGLQGAGLQGVSVPLLEMRALVDRGPAAAGAPVVVDARSERLFRGVEGRTVRAGRIPGAVSLPYRRLLRADGVGLRPETELRQILGGAGLLGRPVVAYCNGGVASTLVLFCLARCGAPLGLLRNYCGSFAEWGNLRDTPVEVG